VLGLSLHPDALDDIQAIRNRSPLVADKILALLEEVSNDTSLMNELLTHGFGSDRDEKFEVKKWVEHWREGLDLWRLKFWELVWCPVRNFTN